MSQYNPTGILVVDGEPIAHQVGGREELFELLIEEFGPLYSEDTSDVVSSADELRSWCDVHAGIEAPVVSFSRDGADFDFYVLTDPWYIFEVGDPGEQEAIRRYCDELGLEPA